MLRVACRVLSVVRVCVVCCSFFVCVCKLVFVVCCVLYVVCCLFVVVCCGVLLFAGCR